MDKERIILVVGGILLLVVAAQAFQLSGLVKRFQNPQTAAASANGAGATLDTTGWSANEIMNYQMHGQIPARLQGQASAPGASSSPKQVGGC